MRKLLPLLLVMLAVCSSAFALDRNFTYQCDDEIADDVAAAISKWNIGGVFTATRVGIDPDIKIKAVDKISGGFRGWTDIENGVTIIRICRGCEHRDSVVLHEFGHAFGLGHSKNRSSIMFQNAKDEASLSPEDQQNIRNKWGK